MNLRILRILVFKAFYAHIFSQRATSKREVSEKHMLEYAEKTYLLYLTIPHLLVAIGAFWKQHCLKKKQEWTTIFSDNFCYQKLASDSLLAKKMHSIKIDFNDKFDDYPEEIALKIFSSSLPSAYLYAAQSTENQRKLMLHILDNFVAPSAKLHDFYAARDLIYPKDYDSISFANSTARKTLLDISTNQNIPVVWSPMFKTKAHRTFIVKLLERSIVHREKVLELLHPYLTQTWSFDRLSSVCQIILQLAAVEIIYFEEIPVQSTISEYLYIASDYLDYKEVGFVNALLDKLHKNPVGKYTKISL